MSVLSRLEAAGIRVVTSLEENLKQLAEKIGVSSPNYYTIMTKWVESEGNSPPTWKSLHAVLRELHLEKLSQEIEEYLSCKLCSYIVLLYVPS